jgi:hypothetical protein
MKRIILPGALVLAAIFAIACSENISATLEPSEVQLSKKGGGSTDTDSRAIWEWSNDMSDGSTPTKIRGDGRLADGSAAGNDRSEFQGGVCGVHGKIFWNNPSLSRSGDAVFDPDANNSGSCAARKIHFDLGGDSPIVSGPSTNAREVMQLGVGSHREQTMQFSQNGIANCELLRFGHDGRGNPVNLTRLASGLWQVESLAPHTAVCWNYSKGKYVPNGPTYNLPFRVVITEVPFGS